MYDWETSQRQEVEKARMEELNMLFKAIPYRVGLQTFLYMIPTFGAVVSFSVYGAVKPENFTPDRIFAAVVLFNIMRFPLVFLPFALVQLGNALVSLARLSQYITLPERKDLIIELDHSGVEIEGGNFHWAQPNPDIKIEDAKKK